MLRRNFFSFFGLPLSVPFFGSNTVVANPPVASVKHLGSTYTSYGNGVVCVTDKYVTKWFLNDVIHRDNNLPAVEYSNGDKEWCQNGEYYRDNDQPAVEHVDGLNSWYQHGKLHRDGDKPAVVSKELSCWYKNGLCHRDNDQPAIVWAMGNKFWYQNGERHRIGGPAAITKYRQEWYQNGVLHRIDGPAVVDIDGSEQWYQNGVLHREGDVKPSRVLQKINSQGVRS